jgi:hypothetical protein
MTVAYQSVVKPTQHTMPLDQTKRKKMNSDADASNIAEKENKYYEMIRDARIGNRLHTFFINCERHLKLWHAWQATCFDWVQLSSLYQ